MTILDPNYPLYAARIALEDFKSAIRSMEKANMEYNLRAKKSEAVNRQLNRRFLLQKIFYRLRIRK